MIFEDAKNSEKASEFNSVNSDDDTSLLRSEGKRVPTEDQGIRSFAPTSSKSKALDAKIAENIDQKRHPEEQNVDPKVFTQMNQSKAIKTDSAKQPNPPQH